MSVNSLIDKFQNHQRHHNPPPDNPRRTPKPSDPSGASSTFLKPTDEPLSKDAKNKPSSDDLSKPTRSQPPTGLGASIGAANIPILTKSGIQSILGDDLVNSPYSEEAILEVVKLKIEQEKTKQQQIKLDIATKNYNILTTALNANIPSYMVPQMCVNPNEDSPQGSNLQPPLQPQPASNIHTHSRSNSQDFSAIPLNYRFGAGSGSSTSAGPGTGHDVPSSGSNLHRSGSSSTSSTGSGAPQLAKRPLSPAKIGAQAVANLNLPTGGYRFPPTPQRKPMIPQHQRHFSMPAETNYRLKAPSIDLTKIDNHSYQQNLPFQQQQPQANASQILPLHQSQPSASYVQSMRLPLKQQVQTTPSHSRSRSVASLSSNRSSPLGPSTMQVKPTPAQPLQKSNKLQPPSQESMTSFQHVIQFQHWKPVSPGKPPSPDQRSHKRHKSNADNMSVDLGTQDLGNLREDVREEDEDADVSMESNTGKDDKRGNYPNILHS